MTIDQATLLDYVMGALSPDQEQEVVTHLRTHIEDAAWVRDMFETIAALALTQEPDALPEGAQDALLERIRREASSSEGAQPDNVTTLSAERPRRAPWIGFALAAAIALFAWVGLRPAYQDYAVQRQLDQACNEVGAVCETLTSDANESLGTLARRANNELLVVLRQAPPAEQVYQAWEIVGDTPRSLGTWQGRVLDVAQPLGTKSLFGISVEPPGGSPQPTTTPIVVVPLSG